MEGFGDGFEAVIPSTGTFFTKTQSAEWQVEIVANYENILRSDLVIMGEGLDGRAGSVVKSLGLDQEMIAGFRPGSVKLGFLPSKIMNLGVKIQSQKTKIMARKIILVSGIAEADDEFHRFIIAQKIRGWFWLGFDKRLC